MKTVVFTIASKNYFAYVRTLMKSLEDSNPHMDRYVVVVDELDDEFIALPRNFVLLELSRLDLPHPKCFQFRYDIMEFNTAVKPFAIRKLFEQYDRVIYLDPDIYVYQRLLPVENALDSGNNFVFTPHFNGLLRMMVCTQVKWILCSREYIIWVLLLLINVLIHWRWYRGGLISWNINV